MTTNVNTVFSRLDRLRKVADRMIKWLAADSAARWLLALIVIAGAILRLSHMNWDMGTHVHPDENFLTMVTSSMHLPGSLKQFFDSTTSPMNPYNLGYGLFVYGTLPIFIVRVLAELANYLNQILQFWTLGPGIPVDMTTYGAVYMVGRAVSALFDVGSIGLVFVLGRRLYKRKVGLLAAAFYAFSALPIQLSHYFTVDTVSTFFTLLTLYLAVRVAQGAEPGRRGGGWGTYLALGASLGASIACRINLAPLAGIALLAAGIRAWDDWQLLRGEAQISQRKGGEAALVSTLLQATLFRFLLLGLMAIAVFRVAQPYSFGGTSVLDFSFATKWLDNMRDISRSTRLEIESPPAHQWANRTPFVFPWVNLVVWGMGIPLGLAAWVGWLVATWQVLRGLTVRNGSALLRGASKFRAHLIPVVWVGGMFLWQGMQIVCSMRYLLPLYPALGLLAAWFLWWLVDSSGVKVEGSRSKVQGRNLLPSTLNHKRLTAVFRPAAYALLAVVTIGAMLWGWGFAAIYRRPLTRITASRWIYANIPAGSHFGIEDWDEGLPLGIDGRTGYGAGGYYGLQSTDSGAMSMAWEDIPEKRERLYQWLNEADYLIVSSNRRWASAPRMPKRFPMTIEYYKRLFADELGFKLVYHVSSFPTVFGHQFNDNSAEEALSVYDHPQVFVFQKTAEYSETLVRSYLDPIDLEQVIPQITKQASQAPTALYLSEEEAARQQSGGTWTEIFDEAAAVNRSQVLAVLAWLGLLLLLGGAAFPIAFVALRGLADRGYGVSKTLGVLALAWLSWIGPSLKIVPYQRWWIALCLGLLLGASTAIGWRRRRAIAAFVRDRWGLLLTEEMIFLVLFGLLLLLRIANPDLWHPARGGEKPMDFAYLNAVIRSTTFPPYDPWHAGGFMNYYYFGFVIVGTLIKLTGIVPWVAYNLAVPTLFALTGLGAFSVAFSLADGDRATEFPGEEAPAQGMRIGPLLAGLAGVFFVTIIGNFGNVKLLIDQFAQRAPASAGEGALAKLLAALGGIVAVLSGKATLEFPNDWWFWNASRVIPDTINEFPFFTFTYADLHAHMIALPLTLLVLAVAVALVRLVGDRGQESGDRTEPSPWCISMAELLPLALAGFVVGALRATNTWDFPTFLLAVLAAIIVLEGTRRARMMRALTNVALTDRVAFWFRAVVAVVWRAVVVFAIATIAFYPFTSQYATAYGGLQAWKEAKTAIPDYLTVWGFFIALAVIFLAAESAAQLKARQAPAWVREWWPVLAVFALAVLGAGWLLKARVWLIVLPLFVLAVLLALGRGVPATRRLGLLLLALALAVTMGVEVVRLKDDIGRMNTVFKFYMQAWTLFGVSTAFGLAGWAARSVEWRPNWRRVAVAVTVLLFAGTLLYPSFAARAKARDRFSTAASPRGLDGMAYMDLAVQYENGADVRLADDKAAMQWMMRNLQGSPVILEAQLPEYHWGSRFSIYTGLPTVQGWNWHQRQQRSVVPAVVERRVQHVAEIYSTLILPRVQHLLDTYNVSYVIVGGLERASYPAEGLAKFDALVSQGYLAEVYREGVVTIYEVVGRGMRVQPDASATTFVGPQPVPTPTAAVADSPLLSEGLFESPQK